MASDSDTFVQTRYYVLLRDWLPRAATINHRDHYEYRSLRAARKAKENMLHPDHWQIVRVETTHTLTPVEGD